MRGDAGAGILMDQAKRRQTLPVWAKPFCTRHCLGPFHLDVGQSLLASMGRGFLETRPVEQREAAVLVSSCCPQTLAQALKGARRDLDLL